MSRYASCLRMKNRDIKIEWRFDKFMPLSSGSKFKKKLKYTIVKLEWHENIRRCLSIQDMHRKAIFLLTVFSTILTAGSI